MDSNDGPNCIVGFIFEQLSGQPSNTPRTEPTPTLSTHELASRLLELPDVPVYYLDGEEGLTTPIAAASLNGPNHDEPVRHAIIGYEVILNGPTHRE